LHGITGGGNEMEFMLEVLIYFIGVPLGIILWKIAINGLNINYNEK